MTEHNPDDLLVFVKWMDFMIVMATILRFF